MKLAYITSSSYSGSTLLSFVLNSNPSIATISEFDIMDSIKFDKDYMCSCGSKLRECVFFLSLKKNINDEGMGFELDEMDLMFYVSNNERINRYLTQKIPFFNSTIIESIRDKILNHVSGYRKRIDEVYHRNDIFMKNVIKLQGGSVFLDANKNPYRLKYLSSKYETSAIYLYKNGIAGAYSFFKASKTLDANPITFEDACTRWFIEQITINRCLNNMKSVKKIDVPYSGFCEDTVGSVRSICELLNIEYSSLDNFQASEHHIIGNVMRTSGIDEIKERLDWKDNLLEKDISTYRKTYDKYINKLKKENANIVEHLWYEE